VRAALLALVCSCGGSLTDAGRADGAADWDGAGQWIPKTDAPTEPDARIAGGGGHGGADAGFGGIGGWGGLGGSGAAGWSGADCNPATGQACLCSATQPCPAGSCLSYQGGPGFCGASCVPHTDVSAICALSPGTPGTADCFFQAPANATGWGCSIRCGANRSCPAGFGPIDSGGWWGCVCVPS
jgi:hypothetical protein